MQRGGGAGWEGGGACVGSDAAIALRSGSMIGATGVSSVRSPESTSRSTPVPVTIFVHEPHTYRSSTFAARPECCEHGGGQSVKPDATLAETGLGPVRRVTEMEKEQLYLRASMSACQRERERES
jgi:hypothetical protein